jgi:SH3 domain protein
MRFFLISLLLGASLLAMAQAPTTPEPADDVVRLQRELEQLRAAQRQLEQDYQRLQADNQRLNEDLAQLRRTAENALAIDERNRQLEQRTVELERSLQLVEQENDALRDRSGQQWFLRGAGVLLAGLLLGVILPRLRPRRASRWGEL